MASADGTIEDDEEISERGSRSSAPVRDRPRKRRPQIEDEEPAVVSGRYMTVIGMILVATIIPNSRLGDLLEPAEPEATHVEQFAVGAKQTVRITLVTADYNLLGCASEQSFDGVHCAYKSQTDMWPRDPKGAR